MDKANVMKALEKCATATDCGDCPYRGMNHCDCQMCKDALDLLKTEHKANDAHTYHTAIIFTKRDNLLKYFWGKSEPLLKQDCYVDCREVKLILLVRHEEGKCICRIKCPINPLPFKGEFEPINAAEVQRLLVTLGWIFKEKINLRMFQ